MTEKVKRNIYIAFLVLIFALGVLLRGYLFLCEKSFWLDEAALALNIFEKSFSELFQPLGYAQSAPYLFVVPSKVMFLIFGKAEWVFRFLPFLASVLSLFAFHYLTGLIFKKKKGKIIRLAGLFAMAFSYPLLYYAIEFKPYSADVLFTILLLIIFFKYLITDISKKKEMLLALFAGLCPMCASGSLFALSAVSFLSIFYKKRIFPVITFVLFILQYFFVYAKIEHSSGLYRYWTDVFINYNPLKACRIFDSVLNYHIFPSRFILGAYILIAFGLFYLFKKNKAAFWVLFLTALSGFCASFLNLYPLYSRTSLFLYPIFLLIFLYGPYALIGTKSKYQKLFLWPILFFFVISTLQCRFYDINSYKREEIKPLILKTQSLIQKGDKVFIFKGAHLAYRFYDPKFKYDNKTHVMSYYDNDFSVLERFCGKETCWIIFASEYEMPDFHFLKEFAQERESEIILKLNPTSVLYKVN